MSEDIVETYLEHLDDFMDMGRFRADEVEVFLMPEYDRELGFGRIKMYARGEYETSEGALETSFNLSSKAIEYENVADAFPRLVYQMELKVDPSSVYPIEADEFLGSDTEEINLEPDNS